MPEEHKEKPPSFRRSRRELWLAILLIIGVFPAVVPFVVITITVLSEHRDQVDIYKEYKMLPELRLANFTHDTELGPNKELVCTGSTFHNSVNNILDATSFPPNSSNYAESKYYVALREDGMWVSILVHPIICK